MNALSGHEVRCFCYTREDSVVISGSKTAQWIIEIRKEWLY